jgi:hypothetical protein
MMAANAPPGSAGTSPSPRAAPTRKRERSVLPPTVDRDRDVLMQCASCHRVETGEMVRDRLTFPSMRVMTMTEILRLAWQGAQAEQSRMESDLLWMFRHLQRQPDRYLHLDDGGTLRAYDIGGTSS